jgi:hypothetical protein
MNKTQRRTSFSTACTGSSATLPALPVGPGKSCMKVLTHDLSLEQTYGTPPPPPSLPLALTSPLTSPPPLQDIDTALSKHVAWSTLEINSHVVTLGDHPSVSSGPPYKLEWTTFESVTLNVDEYEESHPGRRSTGDLLIPKAHREDYFLKLGYARQELVIITRAINKIKKGRRSSAEDGRGRSWSWTQNKNAHGQR